MKKCSAVVIGLFLSLGALSTAHATLINNGNNLIYDTVLNITWYDFTYTGTHTFPTTGADWPDAMSWAAGLDVGGVTGWRLPTGPASLSDPNGGELRYLFFNELGGGAPPASQVPFTNLLAHAYWTGTEYQGLSGYTWYVDFPSGFQSAFGNGVVGADYCYALAVHAGDVGAPVPIPASFVLLAPGLMCFAAMRRTYKR